MEKEAAVKRWLSTATKPGHDIVRKLFVQPPCQLTAASRRRWGTAMVTADDCIPDFAEYSAWLGTGRGRMGSSVARHYWASNFRPRLLRGQLPLQQQGESICASALRSQPTKSGYLLPRPGGQWEGQAAGVVELRELCHAIAGGRDLFIENLNAPDFLIENCETHDRSCPSRD